MRNQQSSILGTAFLALTFRATQRDLLKLNFRHLAFGLVCTWIVGMGRYWDSADATLAQHMGIGSLIYVMALGLLIWLVGRPLAGSDWSFRRLLTFITLTSPPALLYAIPVERLCDSSTAQSLNLGLLGLVAAWRVALLVFYLSRLGAMRWYSVGLLTLLPLTAIVGFVTVLNLQHAVLSAMAGLQGPLTPPMLRIEEWINWLGMLSYIAFGILLVAYFRMAMGPNLARRRERTVALP